MPVSRPFVAVCRCSAAIGQRQLYDLQLDRRVGRVMASHYLVTVRRAPFRMHSSLVTLMSPDGVTEGSNDTLFDPGASFS